MSTKASGWQLVSTWKSVLWKILTLRNLFSFKTWIKPTLFEFPIGTEFAKLEVKYIFPSSLKSVRELKKATVIKPHHWQHRGNSATFWKMRQVEGLNRILKPSPWPVIAVDSLHLASEPIKTHSLSLQMWQVRNKDRDLCLSLFLVFKCTTQVIFSLYHQQKTCGSFYIFIQRSGDSKVTFLVVSNEQLYNMCLHMYPLG